MEFTPVRRQRMGEQIARSVRDAILSGRYAPGEALPSERDLARQFEVNRSTVREALHRLEAWGLIETRHGDATRVNDPLVSLSIGLLPHLLAPGGQLDPKMMLDLLEIRVVLLAWAAKSGAERRTKEDLQDLERILDHLSRADTPAELQVLDFAFFERMVATTQNRVVGLIANAVRQVYEENRELFVGLYLGGVDLSYHRRALRAISQGDPHGAYQAMEAYGRVALDGWKGAMQ